ncbi:hypothetical protein RHSIM_Rhsim03G0124500 [Rhododendron simsii]|uniref:Uncharacterized protein n=1 Tax=Rhododendron simsii TaxID=118357 RepID=A0A834H4M5_RHOSS|nr:hypothetical protein RHSIM_Rhsim03G0124500 [Rhododendron simsii]
MVGPVRSRQNALRHDPGQLPGLRPEPLFQILVALVVPRVQFISQGHKLAALTPWRLGQQNDEQVATASTDVIRKFAGFPEGLQDAHHWAALEYSYVGKAKRPKEVFFFFLFQKFLLLLEESLNYFCQKEMASVKLAQCGREFALLLHPVEHDSNVLT